MKILFNTVATSNVNFRGINDAVNRIKQQIQNGGSLMGDTFTKADDSSTVIIENYYEGGKEASNITSQNSNKGGAAIEGAVSGTTTGSAIEGTKSVAEKIKGNKTVVDQKSDDIDCSDCSDIDSEHEINDVDDIDDIDSELDGVDDLDSEIDLDSGIDVEVDPDIDVEVDLDMDAGDTVVDFGDAL